MTKTNVQPIPSNSQHHDTPNNKTHVIKFRVTAEEKTSLELTCKLLNLSFSKNAQSSILAVSRVLARIKKQRCSMISKYKDLRRFMRIPWDGGKRVALSPHRCFVYSILI